MPEQEIHFPGYEGIPYRGPVPQLANNDAVKPETVQDAKIKVLDTSKADDLQEYERICDNIAKGISLMSMEKVQWVEDTKSWMILIRYIELYAEMPNSVAQRAKLTKEGISISR